MFICMENINIIQSTGGIFLSVEFFFFSFFFGRNCRDLIKLEFLNFSVTIVAIVEREMFIGL